MKIKLPLVPFLAALLCAGCQEMNHGNPMRGTASGAGMSKSERDRDQGGEEKSASSEPAAKPGPSKEEGAPSCH